MPDQTTGQPPKRMTTAEVAALAQGVDGRLDDLSAVVTDLATRLQDLGAGSTPATPTEWSHLPDAVEQLGNRVGHLESTPKLTHDAVDGRIHEALAPLHDEVHELRQRSVSGQTGGMDRMAGVLARLEDAERKLAVVTDGGVVTRVVQEIHPLLSDLRSRLDAAEGELRSQGDPVSHTLAEDALADQIQAAVERALKDRAELHAEDQRRVDQLVREFDDLRQHVGTHGTRVTQAIVDQVAEELRRRGVTGAATSKGTGAAKKVLQLMRLVTSIGKEKEANLGERGGRFMFRGVDQAMDAVGHAMREVGVILGTEILKDETTQNAVTKAGEGSNGRKYENTVVWTTTKLTVRYTFTDPEDGSTHSMEMTGEGRDASDKSTSKAASMALKYGLFQALMIPVTGLDDSDAAPPQYVEQQREQATSQPPQTSVAQQQADMPGHRPQRTEQQKAQRAGEALAAIRSVHLVEGGAQAQYNRLVQIMNQVKSEGLLGATVEGATLNHHGEAAMRTLQAPPPPDDARASTEPPEPPEDYR